MKNRLTVGLLAFGLLLLASASTPDTVASAQNFWERWFGSNEEGEQADGDREEERLRMVKSQIEARGIRDASVLRAMKKIPRHRFVPPRQRSSAYNDSPLPIGYGQTISQPYIVAFMTELLKLKEGDTALEVGTGSGYQAAVLSEMGIKVFTVEIIKALAEGAADTLEKQGYLNVTVDNRDGFYGLPEHGPYRGIIVTAAAGSIPPPLIRQLKKGGRMIIPVGTPHGVQNLVLVEKNEEGKVTTRNVLPVRFVPLTRRVR